MFEPETVCGKTVPLKTTVPPLLLKVPLFVKFPAIPNKLVGAVSVPDTVTVKKLDWLEPAMVVVPLKLTAPLLLLKVPLFVQLPARFNVVAEGAVNVPVTVTLLRDVALDPEMVVVPLNIAVLVLGAMVPLFTKFPPILIFPVGSVNVLVLLTVMLVKLGVTPGATIV